MGVFLIHPSEYEYTRLLSAKNDPKVEFEVAMSEQGFLNVLYRELWLDIGFPFNANLAVFTQQPQYWKTHEQEIRIIHYTMNKPWACTEEYVEVCKLWQSFGFNANLGIVQVKRNAYYTI